MIKFAGPMSKLVPLPAACLVPFLLLFFPCQARPQLVLGQYEDEAPVRTWNTLGVELAPSLACGGARTAAAWDASSVLVNPALLCGLPKLTVTASGSRTSASMFRYSILNTGVLSARENFTEGFYALDFGGLSFRAGDWAFALSAALLESYGRPPLDFRANSPAGLVYSIETAQGGDLRNFNLSAARRLSRRLAAGLGVNVVSGRLERTVSESFVADGITIDDRKSQDFKGLYMSAGLSLLLSERISLAVAVRTPYAKRSDSRSLLEYRVPAAGTDIRIPASSKDEYRQPWAAGAGASWRPAEDLKVSADVWFFKWSSYSAVYFGEEKERDFSDVLRLGAGLEYISAYRLFGRAIRSPLRVGISYDPQPMKAPRSAYAYITFGTGVAFGRVRVDFAVAIGKESGSGHSLSARRGALTLTYVIGD
ncbi:MAG: hypothetical protein MUP28_09735 [Candidatus Aminicenantes bacterium]|nr:hypothetical protein [Candidatus Aminicenantes bacterium]